MQHLILIFIFLGFSIRSFAQIDTSFLLNDKVIQIESTEAVNNMYNFKFDVSDAYFVELQVKHPEHPMPYFLLALSDWWKMMPSLSNSDEDFSSPYQKSFIENLDLAIDKGEALLDKNKDNAEASFFLCAAHGFKGQFFADKKEYMKAAMQGKSALKYLDGFKGKGSLSPEFLFGESLFNYYSEWIKEEYPLLKPIVSLFPKGSKTKGIAQLKECAHNAFYTRIEAQYYLMRIYYYEKEQTKGEETNIQKAFSYARYLSNFFPDNPYFQRMHARLAYELGYMSECETICYDINYKVNIGMPGYDEKFTGRYASYFLGKILYEKNNYEKSIFYFNKVIAFAESNNLNNMGYSLSAYYHMGMIEKSKGNLEASKIYFGKVIEHGEDKNDNTLIYNYCQAAYQLGDIYESEKNKKEAISYYKTAIKYANKMEDKAYVNVRNQVITNSEKGLVRCKAH